PNSPSHTVGGVALPKAAIVIENTNANPSCRIVRGAGTLEFKTRVRNSCRSKVTVGNRGNQQWINARQVAINDIGASSRRTVGDPVVRSILPQHVIAHDIVAGGDEPTTTQGNPPLTARSDRADNGVVIDLIRDRWHA